MNNNFQKTLKQKTSFEGIGLHTGKVAKVSLNPAPENSGIVFKRTDIKKNNIIKANYENISSTNLCTVLKNENNSRISTVEHLVAAFYITGIDNVLVEVDNAEIPIMDGSSKDFMKIINNAGIEEQSKKRKYVKVLKEIEINEGNKYINLSSDSKSLKVDYELDYENKLISNQRNKINFLSDNLRDIYTSRTFCLYKDIEKIKKAGLAKGGSLNNAIVVDENKVINDGGLRNNKEFVNHKILDLAGDFLLSGHRVLGKVKCHQGGHELTNKFLRKLLGEANHFTFEIIEEAEISQKLNISKPLKLAATA